MSRVSTVVTACAVASTLMLVAACEPSATGPATTEADQASGVTAAANHAATFNKELASLRRFLAPFHRIEAAKDAGWDVLASPCLEIGIGGMGFHYGNPDHLGDPATSLLEPELLLYEPQAGGHMRLVGVEYITPLSEPKPDPILGAEFHAVPSLDIWALHVWVWRNNPTGMFADWNPKVSCQHA